MTVTVCSEKSLIGEAVLDGRLKKADLKEDLDPWLLAQGNLLEALDTVKEAAEKMLADKSDRERSAKKNFENVTGCEVALETEEEKLKMRRS